MLRGFTIFIHIIVFLCLATYGKAQITINEIMANPNKGPLPDYEYVELFNNGNLAIQLSEITLSVNNNRITLPFYFLAPKQYVILCNEEAGPSFEKYGNVLALKKWLVLTNTGATISLIKDAILIDEISYKNNWHSPSTKSNGGWSLERINPNWTCGIQNNWSSSFSPDGGTPGRRNSVLNNNLVPEILITSNHINNKSLKITFNNPFILINNISISDFSIDKNIGMPHHLEWNNSFDTLTLQFTKEFLDDEIYTLQINPLILCSNKIEIPTEIVFKQSKIQAQSIIISEILFNPKTGGVDFVEIYNTTEYPINLQNWKLGDRIISSSFTLLQAKQYLAITTNPSIISLHYPSAVVENILQVSSIPSYPNQQGNVTLYAQNNVLIDSIYYNANMHDPLLKNVKGVSLERQSIESYHYLFNTWLSSSNLHENATPGYQNSTVVSNLLKKNNIFLSSKTVSPNHDLHEDFLEIIYELNQADYYLNITIFNEKGTLINRLIRNQSAGSEGKIKWDATNENGQKVSSGHYILTVELYNSSGKRELHKQAFIIVPHTLNY